MTTTPIVAVDPTLTVRVYGVAKSVVAAALFVVTALINFLPWDVVPPSMKVWATSAASALTVIGVYLARNRARIEKVGALVEDATHGGNAIDDLQQVFGEFTAAAPLAGSAPDWVDPGAAV